MGIRRREAALICAVLEVLPSAPRDLSYLLEDAGSIGALLQGEVKLGPRSAALRRYIVEALDSRRIEFWIDRFEALERDQPDLRYVTVVDGTYPANVRRAYDRPPLLFYRGILPPGPATAVVGSRRASPESCDFAAQASRELVAVRHVVVSGLARGVDGLAHDACLRSGGHTVAVLGHALDVPAYPPEHHDLALRIIERGALVSQFKPASPPTASSFVERNSLISALAEVSVVVTTEERSGSRSELEAALAQDRDVVLPGFAVAKNGWMRALAARERRVHVASSPLEAAQIAAEVSRPPAPAAGIAE